MSYQSFSLPWKCTWILVRGISCCRTHFYLVLFLFVYLMSICHRNCFTLTFRYFNWITILELASLVLLPKTPSTASFVPRKEQNLSIISFIHCSYIPWLRCFVCFVVRQVCGTAACCSSSTDADRCRKQKKGLCFANVPHFEQVLPSNY